MEKGLKILRHIEELYVEHPDFSKLEKMARNNPERVKAWNDAFKEYNLDDVLNTIDEYWNFKSSKSKPSVHQIKAMLVAKSASTSDNSPSGLRSRILKCADEMGDKYGYESRERYLKVARQQWPDIDLANHPYVAPAIAVVDRTSEETDFAAKMMKHDIERGTCRHLLPIYNRAVRYIVDDFFSKDEFCQGLRKMSYREKCEIALKKGVFNKMDDVLILICRQLHGKDYQF